MNHTLQNLKRVTTSYKYFYNDRIAFITSAKVGSRFMKLFSDNYVFNKYDFPLSQKLEEIEFNYRNYRIREDFIKDLSAYFFKNREIVFLVRNPTKRFVSGMVTNLDNCLERLINLNQDGKDFLRSYFDNSITEDEYERGVKIFKKLFIDYYETGDDSYIKNIIINYVLPQSIHKDSHLEYHHYMAYNFMKDLQNENCLVKWLDIANLDGYLDSKLIDEWDFNKSIEKFKNSGVQSVFYKRLEDKIETWKSEINDLSLLINIETEYYNKIKTEYEVLL